MNSHRDSRASAAGSFAAPVIEHEVNNPVAGSWVDQDAIAYGTRGSDDHAASVVIQRMQRGGRPYEGLQGVIARARHGQLSEVWFRPEDQSSFDEFFS